MFKFIVFNISQDTHLKQFKHNKRQQHNCRQGKVCLTTQHHQPRMQVQNSKQTIVGHTWCVNRFFGASWQTTENIKSASTYFICDVFSAVNVSVANH